MASAIETDKKYDESVYRYKKEVINTADINITIGCEIYLDGNLYGTVTKESESFYYIRKKNSDEEFEFIKENLKIKIATEVLRLVD